MIINYKWSKPRNFPCGFPISFSYGSIFPEANAWEVRAVGVYPRNLRMMQDLWMLVRGLLKSGRRLDFAWAWRPWEPWRGLVGLVGLPKHGEFIRTYPAIQWWMQGAIWSYGYSYSILSEELRSCQEFPKRILAINMPFSNGKWMGHMIGNYLGVTGFMENPGKSWKSMTGWWLEHDWIMNFQMLGRLSSQLTNSY